MELTKTASHASSVSDCRLVFGDSRRLPLQLQASGYLHVVSIFSPKQVPFNFSDEELDLLKSALIFRTKSGLLQIVWIIFATKR